VIRTRARESCGQEDPDVRRRGRCNFTTTSVQRRKIFFRRIRIFCQIGAGALYAGAFHRTGRAPIRIAYHEKELGQLFLRRNPSKQIVAMLLAECAAVGVRTPCGIAPSIPSFKPAKGFSIGTSAGEFAAPVV